MTESWFMDGVRSLFATIDRAVFTLISIVYEILLQISKISIFGQNEIESFATKVYSLLGLIMLFKVTFSFITYMVNPDQMNDKAKGVQKIIINVILVLVMIIITPTAFSKLYEVQTAILQDQLIPNFFLGNNGDSGTEKIYKISDKCSEEAVASSDGDFISILIFRPFFQVESISDLTDDQLSSYCSIGTSVANTGTVSKYLNANIYNSAPSFWNGTYIIDYKFFISTIVGIVVLLILVSFCFDIAVRTLKLGFLQIIAPVPIISYVDPNSGKNGMFTKWLKEVGKTWASLFVRLAAIFFAVYIIGLIVGQETLQTIDGTSIGYRFWVDLFLIIGALIFAKKLPKLLEDILGFKFDSTLQLNPMKKIKDQALGGKAIDTITKKTVGTGTGLVAGTIAGSVAGNHVGNTRKGMILGALSGASTGFKTGKGAFGKSMQETYKQLTGSEMARFSLSKMWLNKEGTEKVEEIKKNLGIAYQNLNSRQTSLNISEHITAELAQSLKSKGYDISDVDKMSKQIARNISTQTAAIQRLTQERDNIVIKNEDGTVNQQATIEAKNNYETKIAQANTVLHELQADSNNLNQYQSNIASEEALRKEISDINKNIDTMKSQKAQTERFYQIDKSPQKDYNKAVSEEQNRSHKMLK